MVFDALHVSAFIMFVRLAACPCAWFPLVCVCVVENVAMCCFVAFQRNPFSSREKGDAIRWTEHGIRVSVRGCNLVLNVVDPCTPSETISLTWQAVGLVLTRIGIDLLDVAL